jgi:hypothetical protein
LPELQKTDAVPLPFKFYLVITGYYIYGTFIAIKACACPGNFSPSRQGGKYCPVSFADTAFPHI